MIKHIIKTILKRKSTTHLPHFPRPIHLQPLEPRLLLSGTIFVVDNLDDNQINDGKVTLREALVAANNNTTVHGHTPPGSATEIDQITFDPNLFTNGIATIDLIGPLSATESLHIKTPPGTRLILNGQNDNTNNGIFGVGNYISPDVTPPEIIVENITFMNGHVNSGQWGGAISVKHEAHLILKNVIISDNTTTGQDGGGIFISWQLNGSARPPQLTLIDSHISNNSSTYGAGAINNYGVLEIYNTTITQNKSRLAGAAIVNHGELFVVNSIISNNHSTDINNGGGGGIYNYDNATIINSTIAGNIGAKGGGILHLNSNDAFLTLTNTIVDQNIGDVQISYSTFRNNILFTNSMIGSLEQHFIRNPSPGLDGWGDDPTTPDIDESLNDDFGDLRPLPTSPAISAADPNLLPLDTHDLDNDGDITEPLPVDFAGNPRTVGHTLDIGAYEFIFPADFNYDDSVNLEDLALLATHFGQSATNNPAINFTKGDANHDQIVNLEDLALLATYFGQSTPTPEHTPEPLTTNEPSNIQTPQPITSSQSTSDSIYQNHMPTPSPNNSNEAFLINTSATLNPSNPLTPNYNHITNLLNDDNNSTTQIL